MSDPARDEILRRIRTALRDVPSAEPAGVDDLPREYRHGAESDGSRYRAPISHHDIVAQHADAAELLRARIVDYAAQARRIAIGEIASAVQAACAERAIDRLAVATGVPSEWLPPGVETIPDDDALAARRLDEIGAVLTGCALAIAETGTVVFDGRPPSGRRALTLVPDHHICVVTTDQIVAQVPEAIDALGAAVCADRVPVTFVSGSSATSDIELQRVEGVHGPRDLLVLIAG